MRDALIIYTAGVITGGVIVLILLLTFLYFINKAFEKDKKEPWRLE